MAHKAAARKGARWSLSRAIRMYGSDVFLVEKLEEGWDPEIGKNIREPYWISVLNPEYNMTPGGEGVRAGTKHTEEQNKEKSLRMKGKGLGNKNCIGKQNFKGKKHTEQWKKDKSAMMMGRRHTLGRRFTTEQLLAHSLLRLGKKHKPHRKEIKPRKPYKKRNNNADS
jgi:group I intron endonuclease